MKILVDENIPLMTVRYLRDQGHDLADFRGTDLEGMPDFKVWEKAQSEGRLLITTDKGFAHQRELDHHGILIVRLKRPNRQRIHNRVVRTLQNIPESDWPGLLVTVRDSVQSQWRRS